MKTTFFLIVGKENSIIKDQIGYKIMIFKNLSINWESPNQKNYSNFARNRCNAEFVLKSNAK
jgi:hypothetical protein